MIPKCIFNLSDNWENFLENWRHFCSSVHICVRTGVPCCVWLSHFATPIIQRAKLFAQIGKLWEMKSKWIKVSLPTLVSVCKCPYHFMCLLHSKIFNCMKRNVAQKMFRFMKTMLIFPSFLHYSWCGPLLMIWMWIHFTASKQQYTCGECFWCCLAFPFLLIEPTSVLLKIQVCNNSLDIYFSWYYGSPS